MITHSHRPTLTVASYNIHKARGLDRRVDIDRIGRVLDEIRADVVGLQEVYRAQAEALAHRLRAHLVLGVTHHHSEGPYGNAVLTRLHIEGTEAFDLTWGRREPRGGVRVDLRVGGRVMHLFNVHLGLRIRERARQVATLVREHVLSDQVSGPRVVLGDLNEWFPGAVGRALKREFHGPRTRRTHPSPLPLFALDRIYWDHEVHGEGYHVHVSRLARVASDHLPVVARLGIPPRRGHHP